MRLHFSVFGINVFEISIEYDEEPDEEIISSSTVSALLELSSKPHFGFSTPWSVPDFGEDE